MVSRAVKSTSEDGSLALTFRNPIVFQEKLQKLTTGEQITTQVAPAGDTTQRNLDGSVKFGQQITDQTNQRISVSQLISPKLCNRPATTDDLLEISYLGTVVESGAVFDGSAIRINGEAIPGRGNDVSLFFVLNKQPFGQFPPGWDVGLYGMCVGERRRVIIPPVLAYGSVGVPRRGIPPNATLQYDITLVSLNGLAMPQ
jgi:FK506-binding protein 2